MRSLGLLVLLCVWALFSVLLEMDARATDFNWKSAVSGSFNTPGNWLPAGGPPGQNDAAIFNLGSAGYTVTGSGQIGFGRLRVGNDTLNLTGFQFFAVDTAGAGIQLGTSAGNIAQLTLQGSLFGQVVEIGSAAGAQGTLTLNNGTLSTQLPLFPTPPPGQIVVGAGGTGTLSIQSGKATTSGTAIIGRDALSQGTMTVGGVNSNLEVLGAGLTVGGQGTGSLSITTGGTANVAGAVVVGQGPDAVGSINVSGIASEFQTPTFGSYVMTSVTLGAQGHGSLSVTDHGIAQLAGPLVLGESAGASGSVVVNGAQSTLTAPGYGSPPKLSVTVGAAGTGTMEVTGGGTAALGAAVVVGRDAGAEGTLTVAGMGSTLRSAGFGGQSITGLTVGDAGKGTLIVNSGGLVDVSGAFFALGGKAGSQGNATIDGDSSQLWAGQIVVGGAGTGTLTVTNGIIQNLIGLGQTTVGWDAGSNGTFNLSGNTAQYSFRSLTVGKGGTGAFNVSGGATATGAQPLVVGENAGAVGSVTVTGPNSKLSFDTLTLGSAGAGTFDIKSGGLVTSSATVVVGQSAGSSGKLAIDGPVSKFTTGNSSGTITVGQSGLGEVSLTHGATFVGQSAGMIIGDAAGSNGKVTVDGHTTTMSLHGTVQGFPLPASLVVGHFGTGELNITGNATVDSGPVVVAFYGSAAATANLKLDGAGSGLTISGGNQFSVVGLGGKGAVSITNGATLTSDRVTLGTSGGTGKVSVEGTNSLWTANLPIVIGAGPTDNRLTIRDGGRVNVPTTDLSNGGTVEITDATLNALVKNYGTLINDGTILGDVFNNGGELSGTGTISGLLTQSGGTVAPGNSPGTLPMGSLSFQSGAIELEVNSAGGTAGGPIGWDLLACQGAATLYGVMTINLVSLTETNDPGNVFDFNPSQEYHWTFLTAGGGISQFFPAGVTIDTSRFSNPYSGQFQVNQVGNTLELTYAVPEPSTLALAALGLVGLACFRHRRRAKRQSLVSRRTGSNE